MTAPPYPARSPALLILTVLVVATGLWLRWAHLGADFDHFDEAFPAARIARAPATGSPYMNVRDDASPPEMTGDNPHAGASYHDAMLAWDAISRTFPGGPDDSRNRPSRVRAFSAVSASVVLILLAIAAWRIVGPAGGSVVAALTALNPTLVQDAHHARPDAMLTLLVVLYALLVGFTGPPRAARVIGAAIVLGLSLAEKHTMGLLAALPLLWLVESPTRRRAARSITVVYVAAFVVFLITVSMHHAGSRDGMALLQAQYPNTLPIHGPRGGASTHGMAAAYFLATLGAATPVLALAGGILWVRKHVWQLALVWLAPLIVFAACFGAKTFSEHAYSPFLPGLFLAAGAASAAAAERWRPRFAVTATIAALACFPGTIVSIRFVADILSGKADARVAAYDRQLSAALPGMEIVTTPMQHAPDMEAIAERWRATKAPFVVRVPDYNDERTAAQYTEFLRRLPAREFHTVPGPFDRFPVSTFQTCHVPTWHYVAIGRDPVPPVHETSPGPPPAVLAPLRWLLDRPWRYQVLASLAFLGSFLLALRPLVGRPPIAQERTAAGSWLFPLGIIITLLACRWPGFFHYPELNVDEAHTLAGAVTLQFDPVYWRSIDGTTHGPLNDFVLLVPRLFGLQVDFVTGRLTGCLLIAGALVALFAGARALWGEAVARAAVLPALAFLALSTFWDFVHYTSEHLPIFLLTTGWALLMLARAGAVRRLRDAWHWALAGVTLGAVPFAKLQGTPVALVLAAIGGIAAWRANTDGAGRLRSLLALAAGGIVPAAVCAAHLSYHGLWPEFWQAYVLNNLRYATQTKMFSVGQMVATLPEWAPKAEGYVPFALGALGFCGVALVSAHRFGRKSWCTLGGALLLAAVGLYASVAPGRQFYHYLLFTILPLSGLAAASLAATVLSSARTGRLVFASLFFTATLGPQLAARSSRPNPFTGDLAAYPRDGRSRVAREVLHHARAGEPLGIWGYMPRLWVETGLPQAAREGHNERQVLPHPQFAYYRNRYLADLRQHRPPVFLDAVGPGAFWLTDRAQYGHETWPELRDWVAANYEQVGDVDGTRVFVRKDRRPAGE